MFTLFGIEFDIIGLIYIGIILILFISGCVIGLFKTIIGLVKNIAALIIPVFFSRPLAIKFSETSMGISFKEKVVQFFADRGGIFTEVYSDETLAHALQELNLPEVLVSFFKGLIESIFPTIEEGSTIAEIIGPTVYIFLLTIIIYLLLFIGIKIICAILTKLFSGLEKVKAIKGINRLLGGALNAITGILIVCAASFAISWIVPFGNDISNFFIETMKLNDDSVLTLSEYVYNQNFLLQIIAWIQTLRNQTPTESIIMRWIF